MWYTKSAPTSTRCLRETSSKGQSVPTPPDRRSPTTAPAETLKVLPLETPTQLHASRPGRKRRLTMPPLPQEIFDGMTALEQEHFHFFVDAYTQDYPGMTPSDQMGLQLAGLEYINYLRMQASQLSTGQLISMARQHPGVQLRAWLDSMSVTRKARQRTAPKDGDEREADLRAALAKLSS